MMKGLMHSLGHARRGALAITAAGAIIAIAACASGIAAGQSTSSGDVAARTPIPRGRAAQLALCMNLPRLTSVKATTTTTLHALEPSQVLPGGVVVRKRVLVRNLAAALCRLPLATRALVTCPAQLGGLLRLEFSAGGRRFPAVIVQARGCGVVRGLHQARAPSAAFWRTLSQALGFKLPASTGQAAHRPAG